MELGDDGYMDYGLIICQANGRPIMTEHLNKRFKEVLVAMNDPEIAPEIWSFILSDNQRRSEAPSLQR